MFTAKVFQFHKGTIKTVIEELQASGNLKFQFHKGTIKTNNADDDQLYVGNFNSIKVQLKPAFR